MGFHIKWVIDLMEATKLTKPVTFFVILIIDPKFIIKLPKCMLVLFSLINQPKVDKH